VTEEEESCYDQSVLGLKVWARNCYVFKLLQITS